MIDDNDRELNDIIVAFLFSAKSNMGEGVVCE